MFKNLKAGFGALLFCCNTIFWCLAIYPIAVPKLLIPYRPFQRLCSSFMMWLGSNWISINNLEIDLFHKINWQISGVESLKRDCSYLVTSNHQTWVDIVVLQRTFNRKIPFLRFFLKRELIYTPLLGIAWWALDFPFMNRYSKEVLEKRPDLRGKDLETTRKACEKYRESKVSILNFLEGTRFSPVKQKDQSSPYKNLLKPKAGGVAFVLQAMGDQFEALLDVTIHYPSGPKSLWGLFLGNTKSVVVDVKVVPIPKSVLGGDYIADPLFRANVQCWLADIWQAKDNRIKDLILKSAPVTS